MIQQILFRDINLIANFVWVGSGVGFSTRLFPLLVEPVIVIRLFYIQKIKEGTSWP